MKKLLATLTAAVVTTAGALAVPTAASAYGPTYATFIENGGNHSVNHRADMDAQKTASTFLNHETAVLAGGELSSTSPGALGYAGQVKNINPLVYLPLSGKTPSRQPLLGDKTVICPSNTSCVEKVESIVSVPDDYNIAVAYSTDSTMVNPIIEARVTGKTPDKIMPMRTLTRVHFVDGSKLNVWTDTFIAPRGATLYEPYPADGSYPSIYSVNITATNGKEKSDPTYMLPVPDGVKHETRKLGIDEDYISVHSDDGNLETELNRQPKNVMVDSSSIYTPEPPTVGTVTPTPPIADSDCIFPGDTGCPINDRPTEPNTPSEPGKADKPGGFDGNPITPGETQESSPAGSSENSKLGEIVGTIVAVIAALGGIAGLAWWAYQNRPNK